MTRIHKKFILNRKEFYAILLSCFCCLAIPPAVAFLAEHRAFPRLRDGTILYRPHLHIYFSNSGDAEVTLTQQDTTCDTSERERYVKTVSNIRRRTFANMYPRLVKFQEEHGHANVTPEDDSDLYAWTKNLRYNYLWQVRGDADPSGKRKRLSPDKLKKLETVGFSWETKRDWRKWSIMLSDLQRYVQKHGTTHVDPDIDGDLFDWTKSIRANYRHQALNQTIISDRPRLAASKLQALNDLGFDWSPSGRSQGYLRWQDMMPKLKAFKAQHGHTRVPEHHEGRDLYRWTQSIIKNYGHHLTNTTSLSSREGVTMRHFLSPGRLQQLKEIGFDWEQRTSMWERSFQELSRYKEENGHCHVKASENPELSNFCHRQRYEFRKLLAGNATSLTPARMEALRSINFDWARSHDRRWKERHDELKDYVEESGSANIPQKYAANPKLGRWAMNQRTRYRLRKHGYKSAMTYEQMGELEKMGFEWHYRDMLWKRMYSRLKTFQEENGHLEIPTLDSKNSDLRQWINAQRHFYRSKNSSRLTEERINLMESIPGFEWRRQLRSGGPSRKDWSELFEAVKDKGIAPGAKVREHWFDGMDRWSEVKTEYTEQDLLALWNEEEDEEDFDYEHEYIDDDDEESRRFLTA